jgi:hypothetical protein
MKYINKIEQSKFRIIWWLLILTGAGAEFSRTHSYWQALLTGLAIVWLMWVGSMASYEQDNDVKETQAAIKKIIL